MAKLKLVGKSGPVCPACHSRQVMSPQRPEWINGQWQQVRWCRRCGVKWTVQEGGQR